VAVDGSGSSLNALTQSFHLASRLTVVSVVPEYTGDLDMVGVGDLMASMKRPFEKALSEARNMAGTEGAMIRAILEEGEPYEKIVDIAEAENADLIVMGRRGLHTVERALLGSVTARVIGYSQRDVLVVPQHASVGWRKILLATDGSKYSRMASERAIDIAKAFGGELKAVSVVDVPSELYGVSPETVEKMVQESKGYLKEVRQKADAAGVKTETFVKEREAYLAITDLAKEKSAETIIMGSHGRTGLRRLLMGSVVEKVIGYASCPVLVVKS
ncbi:MAG: universal stress protein, partial [Nitrospirae bacterium CG17_big_fil_post_rev_8_21_14_2_50_50_9]